MSLEELAKKTGMSEQYLDAIVSDVRSRLPAFPYVRQSLMRMADLFGLPRETLISTYRREFADKLSGSEDQLPSNRFALPSNRRRYLIGSGALVLIILGYLVSRTSFFGQAHLTLDTLPAGAEPLVTTTSTILLVGSVDPGDKLLVNGQAVPVADDGRFSTQYALAPELNNITFSVQRFLGSALTTTRQVYYDGTVATSSEQMIEDEPSEVGTVSTTDATATDEEVTQ